MKINLNQQFKDLDGNILKDSRDENQLPINKQIGNLIFQSQDKEDPLRSYELAKKIYYSEGETDYEVSEISIIKAKIKEGFFAGYAGQALEIIANADKGS